MSETSKVGISASRVVALIGILVLIRESISYFYTGNWIAILLGVIGLLIAFIVFDSLEIIDFKKLKIPFIWWVLLIIGILVVLFRYLANFPALTLTSYLAGILIILAAVIEFLNQKKSYTASKIVAMVGAAWLIFESIMFIMSGNISLIGRAVVGIIFAILLILTLIDKIDIKIPYSWWVVLLIGFVIFTWITSISGTIIMVAFILLLMAY
jgi:general stress protein CsbA